MRLLVIFSIITLVYSDLPVHCVKHQVVGKWKLFIDKPHRNGPGQVSCGHDIPDHSDTSYLAHQFKEDLTLDVSLDPDYKVKSSSDQSVVGQWTMVYDEGFEITFKNYKYFAFSKYQPNDDGATSFCDQTLVGWYNKLDSGDRGCYRAEKAEKVEQSQSLGEVSVVQPEYMSEDQKRGLGFLQIRQETPDLRNHEEIVAKLNSKPGTWKAKVYDHMIGKSYTELKSILGRKKAFKEKQHKNKHKIDSETMFVQTQTNTQSDFPKNFDWKAKLSEPRQQASCGSCYAIATMEMLSARLKIQGENVDLSPQWSLNCNYYNQGCDGGYPYLVNKFASEQYLVSEATEPYRGEDRECTQNKTETAKRLYQVKNYKYLGGSYGRVNEQVIMSEIYHNGPVVMSFEPSYDFMYYENGIYHSKAESNEYQEWEKVDHSVLCYGWGEEDGERFWLLQNSWGSEWGENGSFRMKKGVDESAIESMVEAAEPFVIIKDQKNNHTNKEHRQNIQIQEHQQQYQQQQQQQQQSQQQQKYKIDDPESLFAFQQIRQNIQ